MIAFDKALKEVLHHEGGYVNHPRDPGGITNLGVTKNTWEAWTGSSATADEMRGLTPAKVSPLYKERYWDKLRCDDLPPALALCVFDFGVNAGPARAARYLQAMVGAIKDGMIGNKTIAAVDRYVSENGLANAVRTYCSNRRNYYHQLGTFSTFGRGWLRRVDAVESAALRLVQ